MLEKHLKRTILCLNVSQFCIAFIALYSMLQRKHTVTQFDTLANLLKTPGQENIKRNAALPKLTLT